MANVYNAGESERIVGKTLAENGKRDAIVLATKVHGGMGLGVNDQGNSRYHIIKACEDSLRRLQADHIDLYQLRRPDLVVPQDETLPIIGPRTMAHLEDALPVLEMALDPADAPLFDALVHPGNAIADFHNSNPWMKGRI